MLELDRTTSTSGSADLAERCIVRLHYFVPGARWAPSYTVRLDRAMRAGSLELRAMVGQATGEDWRDVALTLSTAVPQQWTELPEHIHHATDDLTAFLTGLRPASKD